MKSIHRIACMLAFALAITVAFCGCTITVNIGGGGSSSSPVAVSASSQSSSADKPDSAYSAQSNAPAENASSASTDASPDLSSSSSAVNAPAQTSADNSDITVTEDGEYSDKDHVALYIHEYGHLPSNFISKTKARKAGWVSTKGNLWDVLPGKSIGGSEFYNDEGNLPDARGRKWTECDIDYEGGFRNAKRIVFSNDGLVFYTDDHHKTFEQLY